MRIPTDLRTRFLRHYQSLPHLSHSSSLTHNLLKPLLPLISSTKTSYENLPNNDRIKRFEGGRYFGAGRWFDASCYVFNGILIDTSPSSCYPHLPTSDFEQILLTHHHEDHSGSLGPFLPTHQIYMSQKTLDIMSMSRGKFDMQFYEHLLYGEPLEFKLNEDSNVNIIEDGGYLPTWNSDGREVEGYVYTTPGHSEDMLVYHVPSENAVFAGGEKDRRLVLNSLY
ncbi:hypothetical protein TL16_g01286 [Triparma laevis f. inornata]|uniref:Metallo-beta-lactamase domain-containing protein n=1 Tax=Triparma laevis f. inornata TaxID=1714386 RepID=A0A9W7DRN8_9STRA|nr:hypothetical protein TL16_g01286 [Triparma laevis f. inornata]